jgi:drug/metabolite transporter (DMT)-like permease
VTRTSSPAGSNPGASPGASPGAAASDRLAGVAFVLAAVTCFSGLDSGSKLVSVVPVVMVMWFRYVSQAAMTALTLLPRRGSALLVTRHPALQALRGTLMLLTSVFTYLSLRKMPVGEFTAIIMLTPILMTMIAAFAFGERVSMPRWALIALTFGGALLVVKPGVDAFSSSRLLPFLALGLNTAFHLTTSKLSKLEDVGTMQFYTGITGTVLATLALPFFWEPIGSWVLWAIIALICVLSTVGHGMLIVGYSKAGIATLTPLLFAQIAVSTLLGWLVFSHVPDGWALTGICLIALGGAACTWLSARERDAAQRAAQPDLAALENASMEH